MVQINDGIEKHSALISVTFPKIRAPSTAICPFN